MDDFVAKPLVAEHFYAVLRTWLDSNPNGAEPERSA